MIALVPSAYNLGKGGRLVAHAAQVTPDEYRRH